MVQMENTGASISFLGVEKHYGPVAALAGFNLDVQPGEFVTLLGPSGSGKTTALNILAGFDAATSGDVQIDGRSVSGEPPERRNVGMVFQNFALFPHMTVRQNVAFPLRMRGVATAEINTLVARALEMVELGALAARRPNELSGGQRQRVAFARAIVFSPPVLLMDEPLSALDLKLREAMRLEIRQLHSELGSTILFVTHDQGEALTLSDRVAVMNGGEIIQMDTPNGIYDQPATRFVAEFIGQTNMFSVSRDQSGRACVDQIDLVLEGNVSADVGAMSLRPEKLRRISKEADKSDLIVFDAVIDEPLFLGDVVQYSARMASGETILFRESRTSDDALLRRNDAVQLGFHRRDAVFVDGA